MSSGGPPSTHPDRISPGYTEYIIVSAILAFISTVCVAIRVIHRSRLRDLWWDDWTIIGALIFGLSIVVLNVLVALPSIGGAGYPVETYSIEQLRTFSKIALAAEVLYNPSVSLSRVSILLFYWRIFHVKGRVLITAYILFFLLAVQFLSSVFGLIFSFNPVQAQWLVTTPYTTIDLKAFYISTGAIKAGIDVGLIWLAQRELVTLKLSRKNRLLLAGLFAFSAVTIVATIVRISYIAVSDLSNPTQAFIKSGIWLDVEMFLAIINACLPGIFSFFKTRSALSRSKKESSYSKRPNTLGAPQTIGSTAVRYNQRKKQPPDDDLQLGNTGYLVICESEGRRDSGSVDRTSQVWIDTEYRVDSEV